LKYNSIGYVPVLGAYPYTALTSQNFHQDSSPDERGNIIRFPFGVQVSGGWIAVNPLAAARDFSAILYDADGSTILSETVIDADTFQTAAALRSAYLPFSSPISLNANTDYRWVIRPNTTLNNTVQDADLPSASHRTALSWGENCSHTERTNAGAWTNTTTKRTFCGLVVSAVDIPSSVGGAAAPFIMCRNPGPFCERS